MWSKLEELYLTKALPNRIYLKHKFHIFKMDESKSIDDNIDEFTKLVSDLENLEIKIEEEDQAIFLLNSLSAYNHLRDTIKYSKESLTLKEVSAAAYSKELDVKLNGNLAKMTGEVLSVQGRKEKRVGWICHQEGHFRKYCPQRNKRWMKQGNNKQDGDYANAFGDCEEVEILATTRASHSKVWIMDSGCPFHMTPRKELFIDYKLVDESKVLLANDNTCEVIVVGSIKLKMCDRSSRVLGGVRHVPELKGNLISLGALDKAGCVYKAQGEVLKVIEKSVVIMEGDLLQGIYVLKGNELKGSSCN